ncbi:sensor histidine kinase [Chengkuizengella axinellae]|uniref:histidine kinase n=1 Tax=Chengkuizengella axinellae TaxID=3064388 RepID=A0ABT9IZL9_9BACL|nr:HAMP domain-containing sensor histidine kinase [Chengkuizengella sp. 2205SS18-9]MDP5274808.1 HAMP domain-containing sensor histidine kinase [Chengkuizengella sp. 2205SS18-9]
MLYIAIIFLFITALFTYKNMKSDSIRFLYGMIIGWVISYIALILYLSKFNYYYNIVSQFFNFSPDTWNYLVLQNFDPIVLLRFLNLGIVLFYFSFLGFSISFINSRAKSKRIYHWYIWMSIIAFTQILFYDPKFNVFLQDISLYWDRLSLYHLYSTIGDFVFKSINLLYLAIGLSLLAIYYFKHRRIRFIRNYTLFNLLSLLPVTFLFVAMFSWAPDILIKTTFSHIYLNYLQPQINLQLIELRLFPIIVLITLGFMTFNVYKYNSIETYYRNMNVSINRKIKTASTGVRAFTHAIKNHLLAIQSETEYLKELHEKDKETSYSLDLILKSTDQAFHSIDDAANKLKQITLNMKPIRLHVPIQRALNRISLSTTHVNIQYKQAEQPLIVYQDEEHMNEVIYNIVKNAIEAISEKKGSITIEAKEIDEWAVISIKDTGPGIPKENLEEVFAPFYSTKSPVANWGVGLSYCHQIVTGHDGKIEVESDLGKGTQFNIYLPLFKKGEMKS